MCFFPEPSWKITKENEISLNPDGSRKAQSLNIIQGLQTLNKSLTQNGAGRREWGPASLPCVVTLGEPLDFLCVCSFFSAVAEAPWLFLPHSLLFSSLVSHHLTPLRHLSPACVCRLCAFLPADFCEAHMHLFLLSPWRKRVQKAPQLWFCRRGAGCLCRASLAPGLCSPRWECRLHWWEWASPRGHSYLIGPKHTL